MGLGDVKMLAMIGAFLGVHGVVVTLVFASFAGVGRRHHAPRPRLDRAPGQAPVRSLPGARRCHRALRRRAADAGLPRPAMTRGRGLRRDAPILLPASLLLLAMLASVTLLSYRAAIARFATEREQATLRLAVGLAEAAGSSKSDDLGVLARWLPPGAGLAIYDGRGAVRTTLGSAGAELAASPAPHVAGLTAPRVEGLGQASGERPEPAGAAAPELLRAFVPYERGGQRFVLRLEIPEPALVAQQRSLRILTPVVFGLSAAVALLAIFFLRALVRPYEELLEKARALAPLAPMPMPAGADDRGRNARGGAGVRASPGRRGRVPARDFRPRPGGAAHGERAQRERAQRSPRRALRRRAHARAAARERPPDVRPRRCTAGGKSGGARAPVRYAPAGPRSVPAGEPLPASPAPPATAGSAAS